jgi:energy-coupling factor transporter ATP-binding protein EcfA2
MKNIVIVEKNLDGITIASMFEEWDNCRVLVKGLDNIENALKNYQSMSVFVIGSYDESLVRSVAFNECVNNITVITATKQVSKLPSVNYTIVEDSYIGVTKKVTKIKGSRCERIYTDFTHEGLSLLSTLITLEDDTTVIMGGGVEFLTASLRYLNTMVIMGIVHTIPPAWATAKYNSSDIRSEDYCRRFIRGASNGAITTTKEIDMNIARELLSNRHINMVKTDTRMFSYREKHCIILVGASCSGKTTLENALSNELDAIPVKVFSTREKRSDDDTTWCVEKDVMDKLRVTLPYTFESTEDTIYGYGEPTGALSVVSFISMKRAIEFSKSINIQSSIFFLDTDEKDIERCYKQRGFTDKEIDNRKRALLETNITDVEKTLVYRTTAIETIKEKIKEKRKIDERLL